MCIQQARCGYLIIGVSNSHYIKFVIHLILGSHHQALLVWYSQPVLPQVPCQGYGSFELQIAHYSGTESSGMLHHVTGAYCIQHPKSWTARICSLLCCLAHFTFLQAKNSTVISVQSHQTETWQKTALFSQVLQQNWFNVTALNTASWLRWYYFWPIFRKCPVQILASTSPALTEVFHGFTHSFWQIPTQYLKLCQPLLSTSFLIYCLLITLSELKLWNHH